MKILCLNPPFKTEHGRYSRTSRSPSVTKSGTLYYPIWLAYVAGVLDQSGHEVSLIDSCAYEYGVDHTLNLVKNFRPDLVVLDTSTPSIYEDVKFGEYIKDLFPTALVLLMGTHPTALPEETIRLSDKIDGILVGEADYTARELAEVFSLSDRERFFLDLEYKKEVFSKIDGFAFLYKNEFVKNKERALISDLDELPMLAKVYHKFLDPRKYFFAACDYPEIQIMTSRGCVARCTFCVYPQTIHQLKYRMRSPKHIADEFEWVEKNMPEVREIGIEDDTFAGSQKRVVEFCKEVIERKIKIKWYCNVRVDTSYETMKWMRKAGCILCTVGYESASDEILKNIAKRATADMNLQFSQNAKKAGIMVHGCFMAGNRGETRRTLDQSLKLALKMMDDTMQFFPLMAYPGTADYTWTRQKGFLSIRDYTDFVTEEGLHHSGISIEGMTQEELTEWCNFARRQYYLRPKYIAYKALQMVLKPSEIRRTVKSFRRFAKYLVKNEKSKDFYPVNVENLSPSSGN